MPGRRPAFRRYYLLPWITPLPLFNPLRGEGLSPGEARHALGAQALAYAARRCMLCATGADCSARL